MKQSKFLLLVLFFSVSVCYAGDKKNIDILYSADNESYSQTAGSFKNVLRSKAGNVNFNEYSLSKTAGKAVVTSITGDAPVLVLAVGPQAVKVLRESIQSIPIVFCCIYDAAEYSAPNITGATVNISAELKLAGLKKVIPNVKKIGLIYSDKTQGVADEFSAACGRHGYELLSDKVTSESDVTSSVKKVSASSNYCFMMILDGIYTAQSIKFVLLEGMKNNFPVVGLSTFFTKAGALVSFDCDYEDHGRQAGEIALNILNGAGPSDIKPVRPKKIKYTLNLITAGKLGIEVPESVVGEASEVFK